MHCFLTSHTVVCAVRHASLPQTAIVTLHPRLMWEHDSAMKVFEHALQSRRVTLLLSLAAASNKQWFYASSLMTAGAVRHAATLLKEAISRCDTLMQQRHVGHVEFAAVPFTQTRLLGCRTWHLKTYNQWGVRRCSGRCSQVVSLSHALHWGHTG